MSLNQKAKELIGEIKATSEFLELKQAKSIIDKDRALKRELEGLKQREGELYSAKINTREFETGAEEINKKLSELSRIKEVDAFFRASKRFNDMVENLYKYMSESIEDELKGR
jgi:cell fate (sporulation/competence/biofilm development) regulator YmcA (YheA/YmcA/DUF963 family)